MNKLIGATLVAALASMPVASAAHHSTAMFEWGSEVELRGATVIRWEWTNPHTYLYVNAADARGRAVRWAFEGMSPSHLSRAGWSKATLKAGDEIDLTYYPLRDKRNGGFAVTVTLPNGTRLSQLPSR